MTGLTGVRSEEEQQQVTGNHIKQLNGLAKKQLNGTSNTAQAQSNGASQLSGTRVGVALIGLGRMGLIHLSNLLQNVDAKLLYCLDTDTQGLKARCSSSVHFDELGVKLMRCEDFQLALDDPQVEAVIVATPTKFHEHYIIKALEAGKNVLCEKPLTSETMSILPLYELASLKRVSLMCAFNRRYDADFRNVRQKAMDRERSGDIQLIKITSRDPSIPPLAYLATSGGLLHDSAVHDIDMSLWLMRQLPQSVQVTGKTFAQYFSQNREAYVALSEDDRRTADTLDDFFLVLVTLTFPDGSIALIDNARQSNYGYDQRIEVCCSKRMLKFDGKTALDVVEYGPEARLNPPIHESFATRYQTAYANELKDLLKMAKLSRLGEQDNRQAQRENLLEPNRPMLVHAVHRIADAGLVSYKSGGRPVDLIWQPEFQRQFQLDIV